MNFGFNDEQQEIKGTAKAFLADRFKPDVVRQLAESGSYNDDHWAQISELGWPGIAIDEEHGGMGLGQVELTILAEELGYACAPTPFLANAMAGIALQWGGSDEQKSAHLEGIARGEARGAVGDSEVAIDADGAALLALYSGPGEIDLIPAGSFEVETVSTIDSTRRYGKPSTSGGEKLGGDVDAADQRILVTAAAELVGLAQRALDMSVEYAKDREQFERPIGAYQAVSHLCASMLYDVEEARSLTYYASWAADAEPESLPIAAAMAKARASDAAWEVCKNAIQVHGGIGFTWEHDLHFLLKRARATGQLFGSAGRHRDRVAAMAGMS